jgi:AmmeMemoRadiSam system protein B
LDHGTLVPLYFIDPYLENYKVVRASISGLSHTDHYRFGTCIQRTAEKLGRRTVLIASGDLSHRLKEEGPYSYAKEGPIFDEQVVEAMKTADFLSFLRFNEDFCSAAGECGLRSFIVTMGRKRGLLLPNLEGVTTPEQQIGIALKKAGIGPRESYGLERFEVVRHK